MACQAVIAEHRQTLAIITPVLQSRRPSRQWWPLAAMLAVAATALFVLQLPSPPPSQPAPISHTIDPHAEALYSLELELALMDLED